MDTLKIIDTQQKFANRVYLDFMSKRFGITPCCLKDSQSIIIKKQICDWQESKLDIPEIVSVSSEIFIPSDVQDPCSDSNAPDWCIACANDPVNALELEKILAELKAELENTVAELTEYTALKTELTLKIQSVQEQYDLLNIEIEQKITELNNKQDQLQEKQIERDETNCDENPTLCKELDKQIAELEVQVKDIQEQLSLLVKQLEEFSSELKKLNAQLEEIQAIIDKLTAQKESTEDQIKKTQAQFCIDDSECILIEVVDTNGLPVENFELYIDGGNAGFTDSYGQYRFTITDASININHTLQICYCFTTEGGCRQQKITMTLKADECPVVCEDPISCSDIEITETIIGEPNPNPGPTPPPPPPPLGCPLPECVQQDSLLFDKTKQYRWATNFDDIDDFKVSNEMLDLFITPEWLETAYRTKRDTYIKTISEYADDKFYGSVDGYGLDHIACEPPAILALGTKFGFLNTNTVQHTAARTYGFDFDWTILQAVDFLEDLESGAVGYVAYVRDEGAWYFYDPADDEYKEDVSVADTEGVLKSLRDAWFHGIMYSNRQRKTMNEVNLAIDPYNWGALYIPNFQLTKFF
jgi:hypothetical protein